MNSIFVFGLVSAVTILSLPRQGQLPQSGDPQLATARPPAAWVRQTTLRPAEQANAKLSGKVSVATHDKALFIDWWFDSYGNRKNVRQRFDLDYWPTAAAEVHGALIVAGKRRSSGETLLERWTANVAQLPDVALPTFAKATLYSADDPAKNTVRLLHRIQGAAGAQGKLLVQFHDPDDVYVFDVGAQAWSLIYAGANVPQLAYPDWKYVDAREHASKGYVYVYGRDGDAEMTTHDVLVLLDGDKNGTIDQWDAWNPVEWAAALGDPPAWLNLFD